MYQSCSNPKPKQDKKTKQKTQTPTNLLIMMKHRFSCKRNQTADSRLEHSTLGICMYVNSKGKENAILGILALGVGGT